MRVPSPNQFVYTLYRLMTDSLSCDAGVSIITKVWIIYKEAVWGYSECCVGERYIIPMKAAKIVIEWSPKGPNFAQKSDI